MRRASDTAGVAGPPGTPPPTGRCAGAAGDSRRCRARRTRRGWPGGPRRDRRPPGGTAARRRPRARSGNRGGAVRGFGRRAAAVRRASDTAGVAGPPGTPAVRAMRGRGGCRTRAARVGHAAGPSGTPPTGRCAGAAGAAPVPCASDAGEVAGRAGASPPPVARYGRSAVSVPRASDAPRGASGTERWAPTVVVPPSSVPGRSRCGPCPRRAGRRTRGASPGRGRRCRHRSPYPRPMRRAPRGRRTRPAVAPCPCRRRRAGPSAAEACRPVASGGRTDPGCLRCGGRGAGAGGGRRGALPCSCTPRFLVPGPVLVVRGRCVAARWPGADASRAQIPARPARHPARTTGPAPYPPCVRVTLRRAARRTGTSPQARGICPERPPTLR